MQIETKQESVTALKVSNRRLKAEIRMLKKVANPKKRSTGKQSKERSKVSVLTSVQLLSSNKLYPIFEATQLGMEV